MTESTTVITPYGQSGIGNIDGYLSLVLWDTVPKEGRLSGKALWE